jgi:hypothetical protein
MFHLAASELTHFITAYVYWAVLFFVAIESKRITYHGSGILVCRAIF